MLCLYLYLSSSMCFHW